MDQIKKKMAILKADRDEALDKVDKANEEKKEAEDKLAKVGPMNISG